MDWKGIIAISMACALMGAGVWTNHCSEALSMICSAIVGGVFGLAAHDTKKRMPGTRTDYNPNSNPSVDTRPER